MKRIILTISNLMIIMSLFAQSPEWMSFQAVIRDADNNLVLSQTIGVQISILQGTSSGTPVYIETHSTVTNTNGLVSIEIGGGTIISGDLASVDWGNGPYFVKIQTDPSGGTSYSIEETSQLLSVPYALYAKTTTSSEHHVGEFFGGGIIFWLDDTREHGLILSLVDIGESVWSNISNGLAGTNNWDGANNTIAIIGQSGHTNSAAQLCADYTNEDYGTGVYDDWYLPSMAEFSRLNNTFFEVQKAIDTDENSSTITLSSDWYWSSSEINNVSAYFLRIGSPKLNGFFKSHSCKVRSVRAF
jgi:hypothetical protein